MEKYHDWFLKNYAGETDQAKELEKVLKKKNTGRMSVDYIPWAVAVRMAKQQDPDFSYEKLRNDDENSELYGTLLFYNGRVGQDDSNYFVKVSTKYFGNVVIEEYPCQDFDFESVSFNGRKRVLSSGKTSEIKLDANITNKALQRALTKSIAINTGLALALYEGLDLQFEDDVVEEKVVKTPATTKAKAKAVKEKVDDVKTGVVTKEQIESINELQKDPDKAERINKALSSYKVKTIEDFSEAQAATIIRALGGKQ